MKRLFALMIVLMIAMTTVTALAAEGDATLGRAADGSVETYYSGAFTVGDTLYNRMNSGEVLSLIEQYVAGQINADAMLEGIDAADGEANQE